MGLTIGPVTPDPTVAHQLLLVDSDAERVEWSCKCGHGGVTTLVSYALDAYLEHKQAAEDYADMIRRDEGQVWP
jgi:acetone carboxylase gamma subunit